MTRRESKKLINGLENPSKETVMCSRCCLME